MIRRAFLQALALAALAAVPATLSGFWQVKMVQKEEPLAPGEVSVARAREWGKKVLFVDARPRARFEAGHIEGALLLNEEEWDQLYSPFTDYYVDHDDQQIVVYCDGGGCEASHEVAERLKRELNQQNIFVLKGGWPAWQQKP